VEGLDACADTAGERSAPAPACAGAPGGRAIVAAVPRPVTTIALALLAALTLAAPAVAQDRSVVRFAFPSDDGSLTPYTFTNGYALMTLVYDTLSWRDARGVPQPWLARSIRRTGPRQVEVTLRRGARWHDGRPLTADDVVFTFDYFREHEHSRFTPQLRHVADVSARDPLTVVFSLRDRAAGFEDQPLADVPILPRHLWQGLSSHRLAPAGLPVGSGPYRLVSYRAGQGYRFEANRGYFRGRPTVDRIEVPIIGDRDEIATRLARRRLDAAPVVGPAGTPLERSSTVRLGEADIYTGTVLELNLTRAPFDDPQARRAVALALDLRRFSSAGRGPASRVRADRGVIHPRSPWAGDAVLHRFDAAAARIAFSEQGVGAFEVAASRSDPVRIEAARRVVRALQEAGAQVRLREMSPDELNRAIGAEGGRPTVDAAVVAFPALASYDPSFLHAVFGSSNAPLNDRGYRSARFERLAERVDAASTTSARRRAVEAQLRLLADDLPVVPLFFGGSTFAYRPAAYDRWVDVRGSGILDKRSFVDRAAAAEPAEEIGDPTDPASDDGISLLPLIVVLAVVLVAALAWGMRRSRSA
jgi:peptide/nickel transport system substrate-binding protein